MARREARREQTAAPKKPVICPLCGATNTEAAAKKVKLSSTKLTLTVGQKKTLTVKKGTKKFKGVKWRTGNKKVATVSSGKITAKKAGKATITATVSKKKYTCKVTVKEKKSADTIKTTNDTTTNTTTNTTTDTTTNTNNTNTTNTDTSSTPTTSDTPSTPSTPGTSDTPSTPSTPETPAEEVSEVVEWSVTEEPFVGAFSQENDNGETENFSINLIRKYVSFNPWPTTNEQVRYLQPHISWT